MFYIKTLSFMKTRLIFLLPLLWMLIGCSDSNSDSATLEISQSTFDNINSEGSIIKVSVTCNSTWRTISNQSWCIPNLQNGSNDGELVLTIHANTTSKERSATLTRRPVSAMPSTARSMTSTQIALRKAASTMYSRLRLSM